jgi:hypothetical protein
LFWSGEAFSSENRDYDIAKPIMYTKAERNTGEPLSPLNFDSDTRFLNSKHRYWGLPMYYAWCLASTNNYLRELCRKNLSKWAANNIENFIELLNLMFFCGDPQVQEDLSKVMLGAVTLTKTKDKGLKLLSNWVINNVFNENKIQNLRNSVVRYCARIVVERAFMFDEATEIDLNMARPPYFKKDDLLELDLTGDDETLEGRYPIVHDLDWNVIGESFAGFLDYKNIEYSQNTERLLNLYWEKYNFNSDSNLGIHEFAVAAAINFIKSLGFNRAKNEGNTLTHQSHGFISPTMTLEEKYTWLAVREIQGYLADLVEFKYHGDKYKFLSDYSLILHVPSPIDETELTGYSSHDYIDFAIGYDRLQSETWFIPTEIATKVQFEEKVTKEDLEQWAKQDIDHDFRKWLMTNDFFTVFGTELAKKAVVLYNDTHIADPSNIGNVNWSSVCVLIDKSQFQAFIDEFQAGKQDFYNSPFSDLNDFKASTKPNNFSPRDLAWMSWVEEENSKTEWKDFNFHNTLTKVVENTISGGEKHYILPSKLLREGCKIASYENGKSFDNQGNVIIWTHSVNVGFSSEWGNKQELLFIDKDAFDKILEEKDLKPIWVFYQLKNTTLEFRKPDNSPFAQNSKKWIVWDNNDKTGSCKYHDARFNNQND